MLVSVAVHDHDRALDPDPWHVIVHLAGGSWRIDDELLATELAALRRRLMLRGSRRLGYGRGHRRLCGIDARCDARGGRALGSKPDQGEQRDDPARGDRDRVGGSHGIDTLVPL